MWLNLSKVVRVRLCCSLLLSGIKVLDIGFTPVMRSVAVISFPLGYVPTVIVVTVVYQRPSVQALTDTKTLLVSKLRIV